jgi:glycosyltransferase involved in cell wall biosynthesis
MKTNVVLSDRPAEANEVFRRGLEEGSGEKWEIWACVSNRGRSRGYNAIRYFKYLFFPLLVHFRRGRFAKIVAWQGFYAVQLAFWGRVLGRWGRGPDLVLGIPFIYRPKRGWIGRVYRWWVRFSAGKGRPEEYVVTAEGAKAGLEEALGMEPGRIHFFGYGFDDSTKRPEWEAPRTRNPDWEAGSYWLATGRSNRDYGWLEKAWRGSGRRLHILCDEWNAGRQGEGLDEVRVSRDLLGKDAWPELREAKGMVLPLADGRVDSGVLALLQAWMAGKPVVVTGPSLLAEEYVRDGETGLVAEKDADGTALRAALARLERDPGLAERLGAAGRKEFEGKFSEFEYGRRIGEWMRRRAREGGAG